MAKSERFQEEIVARRASRNQTADGLEIPDPVPLAPPVGYTRSPSIAERIREMVRSEHLRRAAEDAGAETFEEADDFEVEDDPEPLSGYENESQFEPILPTPSSDPTGVPPPSGGGKGGGEPTEAVAAPKPAEATPSVSPAPASPTAS